MDTGCFSPAHLATVILSYLDYYSSRRRRLYIWKDQETGTN